MTTEDLPAEGNPAAGAPQADLLARTGLLTSPPLASLAVVALVGAVLALLRLGAPLINPLLLALFFAALALPAYRRLQRRGLSLALTLVIIVAGMLVVGLGLALLLWLSGTRLLAALGPHALRIRESVTALMADLGSGPASTAGAGAARFLLWMASSVAGLAVQAGIGVVLAAFLLLEAPRAGALLRTHLKEIPFLGTLPQVMDATVQFMLVRLRVNLLTGLVFGLLLTLLGVRFAWLWGALAVPLAFVPYVGLVAAAAPAVLLALADSGVAHALLVALALTAVNFAIEYLVAPTLAGRSLRMAPATVLFSYIAWVWLLGGVGALVAVPLTLMLILATARHPSTAWVADLLGSAEP